MLPKSSKTAWAALGGIVAACSHAGIAWGIVGRQNASPFMVRIRGVLMYPFEVLGKGAVWSCGRERTVANRQAESARARRCDSNKKTRIGWMMNGIPLRKRVTARDGARRKGIRTTSGTLSDTYSRAVLSRIWRNEAMKIPMEGRLDSIPKDKMERRTSGFYRGATGAGKLFQAGYSAIGETVRTTGSSSRASVPGNEIFDSIILRATMRLFHFRTRGGVPVGRALCHA